MKRQDSITLDDITNFLKEGALWRKGDDFLLCFGPFSEARVHNNQEVTITYDNFFNTEGSGKKYPVKSLWVTKAEFDSVLEGFCLSMPLQLEEEFLWEEAQLASFTESFDKIKKLIGDGKISKAVPIVFERTLSLMCANYLAPMLRNIIKAPDVLNIYGFWSKGCGVLGASPELLYQCRDTNVQTMALAGTAPKIDQQNNRINPEDLLKDPKERYEHQLVVEDIVGVLTGLGSISVTETKILELPQLYHLLSRISLNLDNVVNKKELVKKLHPTAALAVSPRAYGFEWMKALPEQEGRGGFGGPFLIETPQEDVAIVAIRSIQWDEKGMRIGSGCGIVKDSILEKEWHELKHKRLSIKKLLGLVK